MPAVLRRHALDELDQGMAVLGVRQPLFRHAAAGRVGLGPMLEQRGDRLACPDQGHPAQGGE